jgi:radical SAM-linked protein
MTYKKKGRIRYLSHLDLTHLLGLLIRRTEIPVAWSAGFNPQPRLQFGPPLSVGFEGEQEMIDIFLLERIDTPASRDKLNALAPEGLEFFQSEEVPIKSPSIGEVYRKGIYEIVVDRVDVEFKEPDEPVRGLIDFTVNKMDGKHHLELTVSLVQHEYQNPMKILSALAGTEIEAGDIESINRLGME